MEVLTGERTLTQTVGPAIHRAAWGTLDLYLSAIPVVGSLVAIGESIVGRDLSGRKLSGTERALMGGLAVLSELGLLLRAGAAINTAARLRVLSTAKVAILRNLGQAQALYLVAGARVLTFSEKRWLEYLARIVKSGGQLTAKQIVQAHRLLAKMGEGAMVAAALRRNAQQLASATGVVLDVMGATLTAAERRVAEVLMKHFGVQKILCLADLGSSPAGGVARGVPTADFVVVGPRPGLVEAYSPVSTNLAQIMERIGVKHRQAGVIAVDLTATSVDTAAVKGQLAKLWGDPNRIDISRVIIIKGQQVTADIARPAALTVTELGSAVRAGAQGAAGARRGDR